MHPALATLVTALYAFTSGSIHGTGNEGLGLAPVLSIHPANVANAFTDTVLPFATSLTTKVIGAPTPTRSIDTGQHWDPFFSSKFDGTLPPASPVHGPPLPLPGSTPWRLMLIEVALNGVDAFDISPTAAPHSNEDVVDESPANEGSNVSGVRVYIRTVSLLFRKAVFRTTDLIGQAASDFGLGRDSSPVIKDVPTPTTKDTPTPTTKDAPTPTKKGSIRMNTVLHSFTGRIGELELASVHVILRSTLNVFSSHWTTFISRLYGAWTTTGIFGTIGIALAALVLSVATRPSYLYTVTKRRTASRTTTTDLAPEYVPLPVGAENIHGLAREKDLLPEREENEPLGSAIVLAGEEVEEEQALPLLPVPATHNLAPVAHQLPARSTVDDAHPMSLADADGKVGLDSPACTSPVPAHASLDANTDEDEDSWIHSVDASIASRFSTLEEDVSRKVTSSPDLCVFAGTTPVLDTFDAIRTTFDAAQLALPQSDAVESPRALASALELENVYLPIPPAEYDVMDSLSDEVPPFDLPPSDAFDDIAHLAVSEGVIPPCRPSKFVSPADWEDGEDYIALALRDGCEYESLLDEGPRFELPPSDSFDDIVHVAVANGVVPPRPSKFCPPADWEDGEDYVALALLDGGGCENLLDEVPPFDILGSASFDDILYCDGDDVPPFDELFAPSGELDEDATDGDEFGALELALRKFEEEDGENLLEMALPSLPSAEVIEEYAVPLFCRTTRRPMERAAPAYYLDERDTSTSSMDVYPASPDRATPDESSRRLERQAAMRQMLRECEEERVPLERMRFAQQPLALNINCLSSATSMPGSHKGKGQVPVRPTSLHFEPTSVHSRASTLLKFERESTPGFDFDTDSPGPRTPYSRERSPSESPSPRTPAASFDTCDTVRYQVGDEEHAHSVKAKGVAGSVGSVARENVRKDMLIRQLRVSSMGDAMMEE